MQHRRTPGGPVAIPATWFIVASALVVIAASAFLGVLLAGGDDPDPVAATPAPSATTPAPTPTPTPVESPTPSPTPTETAEPVARDSAVVVLNNTGIANLASGFSGQVAAAGWTVSGTGNWNGQIPTNTVYYPAGLQPQAELLGEDVGIGRVLPSVAPMQMDRLTIILSGPQQ